MSARKRELTCAIERVLEGDKDAYELIYRQFDPGLRAFIGSRYGRFGQDFVDEVAARTHAFAASNLNKYRPGAASFHTWLALRSRNFADQVRTEWLGMRRKRDRTGRRRVVAQLVRFDAKKHAPWVQTEPGPEQERESQELPRLLRQSFSALPVESQCAIALHDMRGLTFAATATIMRMSVPKVRRVRERGLAVLRRRLQELGVRPVEVDSTPQPIWYGKDSTGCDDDWTATAMANLPGGPDSLVGADAKNPKEEVPDE